MKSCKGVVQLTAILVVLVLISEKSCLSEWHLRLNPAVQTHWIQCTSRNAACKLVQTGHRSADPLCRFCYGCWIYSNCSYGKCSKDKGTVQPLCGIKCNLAVTTGSFQTRWGPVLKADGLPKSWYIMYHKYYASFWHTSMNFSFVSIISRSISSSISLDSKVDFADNISITWFGRSLKNTVRCISHRCFFYWLLYYLLKLQINFRLAGCPRPIWFSSFSLTFHFICLLTTPSRCCCYSDKISEISTM